MARVLKVALVIIVRAGGGDDDAIAIGTAPIPATIEEDDAAEANDRRDEASLLPKECSLVLPSIDAMSSADTDDAKLKSTEVKSAERMIWWR